MTLRSPLGLRGKARAHDTLAYRGSNTWKYISMRDRGEDGRDDGGSTARSIHQRPREEMAFAGDHRLSVSNMDTAGSSNLSVHGGSFHSPTSPNKPS